MTKDDFLGHYWSQPIEWNKSQRAYIRGHSPWVEGLFSPDHDVHELCLHMLELESKYDRRWHWWSLRIPPPLWTMVFLDRPEPPKRVSRLLALALLVLVSRKARP